MSDDVRSEDEVDLVLLDDVDELYVTFFLKLPEPISVPSEQAFPARARAGAFDIGWLRNRVVKVLGEEAKDHQDFTNTYVTTSSMILHHVKVDAATVLGLDASIMAAAAGIAGSNSTSDPRSKELTADCTVAEIALPVEVTRVLNSGMFSDDWNTESLENAEEWTHEQVKPLLNLAIDAVREFQSAYHSVQREPLTLLTAQTLPPLIPYVVRTPTQIARKQVVEMRFFPLFAGMNYVTRKGDLSSDQVSRIFDYGNHLQGTPISTYLDLDREAGIALIRLGNTRSSVVMAAAAAEVILNLSLLMMLWEEGKTPEDVAKNWSDGLAGRVKSEYGCRLGGSWDQADSGTIGDWSRHVAGVRHRVVHAGYLPSYGEAEKAIDVSRELLTYIGDSLSRGKSLNKYPRTAIMLIGSEGLQRRGRYTNRIKRLQKDVAEPPWAPTFGLWHKAYVRLMGDKVTPRVSDLNRAGVLAVYHEGKPTQFIAHDEVTGQAVEVHIDGSTEEFSSMMMNVENRLAEHAASPYAYNSISIKMAKEPIDNITLVGDWLEEYRLMPLRGVMVNWSNFTAPAP
ncbi:hypothetical protein ACFV4N_13875 [Actinosynnema sp. NPDC059797]